MSSESAQPFGGAWTQEKLDILEAYLDAYTTALKNQRFNLWYVDAFAGSGSIAALDDEAGRQLLTGSPEIALRVDNKPFDNLLFIEKDAKNSTLLDRRISSVDLDGRAEVKEGDANTLLPEFCNEMGLYDRAVVFLDPFGTQVRFSTIEALAETEKCDVWILFPVSTVRRLLPIQGQVRSRGNEDRLTSVFGDESWRELQHEPAQIPMFPDLFPDLDTVETDRGVAAIVKLYLSKLESVFAQVAPEPRTLSNSRNSPMYEFMFAAGNRNGAPIAVKIADYLLTKL